MIVGTDPTKNTSRAESMRMPSQHVHRKDTTPLKAHILVELLFESVVTCERPSVVESPTIQPHVIFVVATPFFAAPRLRNGCTRVVSAPIKEDGSNSLPNVVGAYPSGLLPSIKSTTPAAKQKMFKNMDRSFLSRS